MQKVYKDIHKKILQIIQCKCINWDVTDSRSSLVLSSEFVVNKNNPTGIGEKCQYFDHYFCFVCLQKLMQDFLSANGKKGSRYHGSSQCNGQVTVLFAEYLPNIVTIQHI